MDDTVAASRPRGRRPGDPGTPRPYRGATPALVKAAIEAAKGQFRIDIDKEGQISLIPMESAGDLPDARGASEWDNPEKWDKVARDEPDK